MRCESCGREVDEREAILAGTGIPRFDDWAPVSYLKNLPMKRTTFLCRECYLKELRELLQAELKRLHIAVLILIFSIVVIILPFPGIDTATFIRDPDFVSQLDEMYFETGVLWVAVIGVFVAWGYLETIMAVRNAIRRVEGNMRGRECEICGKPGYMTRYGHVLCEGCMGMRLGADMVRRCQMPMLGAGMAWMGMVGMGRREWDIRIGGTILANLFFLFGILGFMVIILVKFIRVFTVTLVGMMIILLAFVFMVRGSWLYTREGSVRKYVEEGRKLAMRWEGIARKCGVEPVELVKVVARWYASNSSIVATAWTRNYELIEYLLGELWDGRKEMEDDERRIFGCVVKEWYPNSPPQGPGMTKSLGAAFVPELIILVIALLVMVWAMGLGYVPFQPKMYEDAIRMSGKMPWSLVIPAVALALGYLAIWWYRHYIYAGRNARIPMLLFLPLLFPLLGFLIKLPAGAYPTEVFHALLFSAVSGISFSMIVSALVMMHGWNGGLWSWLSGVGAFVAGMGWQLGELLESVGFWVFGGLFKVATAIPYIGSMLLGHMVGGRGREYPGLEMFIYCFLAMVIPSIIGYLTVGVADGLFW